MTITVRGSGVVYINNAESGTISLPASTVAGDYCVLFAKHGYPAGVPIGWTQIDFQYLTGTSGATFEKVLTSADIAAGSVSVGFGGIYGGRPDFGLLAIVSFVGSLAGYRAEIATLNASSATTRTIATGSTPLSGDYALCFACGRFNGTVASSIGSTLQSATNTWASAIVAGVALSGSGAVSDTFTFSAGTNDDYEAIVVIAPAPLSTVNVRATLLSLEPLTTGSAAIRAPLVVLEPLTEGNRNLRVDLITVEPLTEGYRNLRVSFFCLEALYPVLPGGHVSTALFPGSLGSPTALPGLTYTIHKRPTFSTSVYKGASGVSVRRANMQYPIWEFDLTYEFLRDNVNAEFQTLCGFFLSRQGGYDTFLMKDKDDYQVTNGTLGTADGVTTQFPFLRNLGGFNEKVGQVDNGLTITVYGTIAESDAIPSSGPYTVTVAHAADFVADNGVTKGGVAMTPVAGSPGAGQYSVAAGVYTFNSADHGAAVIITYRYLIHNTAYTVTMPNLLVFSSAPASGIIISADFQFFFNLRFQNDNADFDKFAETFWELQKITLESVPQ